MINIGDVIYLLFSKMDRLITISKWSFYFASICWRILSIVTTSSNYPSVNKSPKKRHSQFNLFSSLSRPILTAASMMLLAAPSATVITDTTVLAISAWIGRASTRGTGIEIITDLPIQFPKMSMSQWKITRNTSCITSSKAWLTI